MDLVKYTIHGMILAKNRKRFNVCQQRIMNILYHCKTMLNFTYSLIFLVISINDALLNLSNTLCLNYFQSVFVVSGKYGYWLC